MRMKLILKIVIPLLVSTLLISCDEGVTSLTKQNVLLASGVSFNPKNSIDSNKLVVINSKNEKEVQSCGKTIIENNNPAVQRSYDSKPSSTEVQNKQKCNNTIFAPSEELLNALSINKPLKGFILKDGEKDPTEAVFVVTITAVYKGSHCNSLYGLGYAYTLCVAYDF